MKQVLLHKGVVLADVPAPLPGARQVLVEVAYSFISTGTEVAGAQSASAGLVQRIMDKPQRVAQVLEMIRVNGIRKTIAQVQAKLNTSQATGYSCSGRVLATGREVQSLAVGDAVACAGGGYANHAEVVAVPVNLVARVPEGCDLRWASGATIAAIALQGIRRADLRLGETAVVMGLGLLGQITLQLLAATGVRAIGLDPDEQRVAEAKALGFPECFALVGESAVSAANARTGAGADATIITAASSAPGICQNAIEMTRRKGKVVVVGAVPLAFERSPLYAREIDFLISCSYGPGRYDSCYEEGGQDYPPAYVRWTENRNIQAVLDLMAQGKLNMDRMISAEFPVAQVEQAFEQLSQGSPRPLGVVLKYDTASSDAPAKRATSVQVSAPAPLRGRIGLGIVGTGAFFTSMHLPSLAALADMFAVVSVCDSVGSRARDVAGQLKAPQACSEVEPMLANPDVRAVMITTRHNTHASLAMQALQAGKAVFVEKPMAMNDQELEKVLATISASGQGFLVGFNRRFSPHVRQLRAQLADRVSPLVVSYRVLAGRAAPDSWIHGPSGGGRVIGEACHMFDLFNYLVGEEVELAELNVAAPEPGQGGPPGDNFVAALRYADGSLCTLTYSSLGKVSKHNGKERIEALWDGKTFLIDDFVRCMGVGCSAGSAAKKHGKGHHEELVAWADWLLGKGPAPISVEACRRATEISFRVDEYCRYGQISPPTAPAKDASS